jgi:hypothetical protein
MSNSHELKQLIIGVLAVPGPSQGEEAGIKKGILDRIALLG